MTGPRRDARAVRWLVRTLPLAALLGVLVVAL